MKRLSKQMINLVMISIFLLPFLIYSEFGQAKWMEPDQITSNYTEPDDVQAAVTFDGKGYIHFAHVQNIGETTTNYLYYGNNSLPGYDSSDFIEDDSLKMEVANVDGDTANLVSIAQPSISASADGTPIVAFHATNESSGEINAYASVIDTNSGEFKRHQLSYEEDVIQRSSPHSSFNNIVNSGDNYFVSQSGTDDYIVRLKAQTTFNPNAQEELTFLGTPNDLCYNGSYLFAAAGKTLVIFSAPSLNSIGSMVSYLPFTNDIMGLYWYNQTNTLFVGAYQTVYAINITDITNPSIISQASVKLGTQFISSLFGISNAIYAIVGTEGMCVYKWENNKITYVLSRRSQAMDKFTDMTYNPIAGKFYFSTLNGIYYSNVTDLFNPSAPAVRSDVSPGSLVSISYNNTNNVLAVVTTGKDVLIYTDWESTSVVGPTALSLTTANDVITNGTHVIIAGLSAGILIYTYAGVQVQTHATTNLTKVIVKYGQILGCDSAWDIMVFNPFDVATHTNTKSGTGGGPMFTDGSYLYINDQRYGALVVADIRNPNNIQLTAMEKLPGTYNGRIFVYNKVAYVTGGTGEQGFLVIDCSNPTNIQTPLNYTILSESYQDFTVVHNGAQIAGYAVNQADNSIRYLNFTTNILIPSSNTSISGVSTAPKRILVEGQYLFVVVNEGVREYGLSNLASPNYLTTIAYTNPSEIDIEDNVLYITAGSTAVRSYDLLTTTTMDFTLGSAVNAFIVYDCAITAATAGNGIQTIDASSQTTTSSDSNVSIAHLNNGTAFVVWENNLGISYRKIYSSGIKSKIYTLTSAPLDNFPQMKITQFGETYYIHIVFLNGNTVNYYRSVNGAAFASTSITGVSGTISDPRIDAKGSNIGIVWETTDSGNDIQIATSTNNGTTLSAASMLGNSITAASNPDIYVSASGLIEVVYQRAMTQNSTIFLRSNMGEAFSTEYTLVDYSYQVNSQKNPRIAEQNGTVVIFYEGNVKGPAEWYAAELYVLGYHTMNYNSANYETLTIHEDPAGQFLFEGMKMKYNTTSTGQLSLTFKIVDEFSNLSWSNTTTISGTGAPSSTGELSIYFWNPDNYFITNSSYTLYVYNSSDFTNVLFRIAMDSFAYTPQSIFNFTIPSTNGTYSHYDIQLTPILEYGNALVMDPNGVENELYPRTSKFSTTNNVDLFYVTLTANRAYNFYLKSLSPTIGHVRLMMYNDSVQLTQSAEILAEMNSNTQSVLRVVCNRTGTYAFLVQPLNNADYQKEIEYQFYLSAAPLAITLTGPRNRTTVAKTDLGPSQAVQLKWSRSSKDTDISYYQIQVYNGTINGPDAYQTNMTVYGISTVEYTYNVSKEAFYYWRVRGIDDSTPNNFGEWSAWNYFAYDPNPPMAPVVHELPHLALNNSVDITWEPAYDGIFTISKYWVYMYNRPVFTAGEIPSEEYLFTETAIKNTRIFIPDLKNYHYYFVIVAEDNVGLKSTASNMVNITIAIGGYVPANNYNLTAQVGDTLLYEVTYVDSPWQTVSTKEPYMTFYYNNFVKGTQFHFWIQEVDNTEVYPVVSQFYAKYPGQYQTGWNIIDEITPISLFAMSPSTQYQMDVCALFVKNEMEDTIIGNRTYDTLWRKGLDVLNVHVYTFYGQVDGDGNQASCSFFVEKDTGILVELVYYSKEANYGYSLQLLESSFTMNSTKWQYAPIYLILGATAVGLGISLIIKKVEF